MAGFNAGTGTIWFCSVLAGVGAIELPSITVAQTAPSNIVPDATLGAERSQVNSWNTRTEIIQGGAARGINLFQSFREFNVGEGRSVYFISPSPSIQNILARVTGSNASEILGRLGTARINGNNLEVSNANLFLINPNGILFGANARLDVDRSFAATTADAVQFGDRGMFSATQPEMPSALLMINLSAFLFDQIPAGNIVVQANQPIEPDSSFLGLKVPSGEALLLLGGNVTIDGGNLNAWGGRVEIGAISGDGIASLENLGRLNVPQTVQRGDVSFTNGAKVDVTLDNGGDIRITGRNINVSGGSLLKAGISTGLGTAGIRAGDLMLDATNEVRVIGESSRIENNVNSESIGNGGNLTIKTGSLTVADGAQISTSTFGQGNAGNIVIEASNRVLFNNGDVYSNVVQDGKGKGGNISIQASSLELLNGALLSDSTNGQGDAGNIVFDVHDSVLISGTNSNDFPSSVRSRVDKNGKGNGGNIRIDTGVLEVSNGAKITASTLGQGNAGNVVISANDRALFKDGYASSSVEEDAIGHGGNLQIFTEFLGVMDKSYLDTDIYGKGNAGSLLIDTGTLAVTNGGILSNSTTGKGNAGNLIITVRNAAFLDGESQNGIPSSIASLATLGATGNGGNLTLAVGSLSVTNGAVIGTNTFGQGNAGNLSITVRNAAFFDGGRSHGAVSIANTSVGYGAVGSGGNFLFSARSLTVSNGAQLSTSTFGQGDAGNLTIAVRDIATFDGEGRDGRSTQAASEVREHAVGNGGNLTLAAGSLFVTNGAQLTTSTFGQGNAGNLTINVRDAAIFDGERRDGISSKAASQVNRGAVGNGGSLTLSAGSLFVTNGAQISGSTLSQGNSGDLNLTVRDIATFDGQGRDGFPSGAFSNVQLEAIGNSGNLTLVAGKLALTNGAVLSTASVGSGRAGNLTITAQEVRLENQGLIEALSLFGDASNITLNVGDLLLKNQGLIETTSIFGTGGNIELNVSKLLLMRYNSQITTTAGGSLLGGGNGGNININAPNGFTIAIPKENSDITANAFSGSGGNITINSQGVFGLKVQPKLTPLSDITASSDVGLSGTVNLNTPDNTVIQNSLTEFPQTFTDTTQLLANSCIVRRGQPNGSFTITGSGGLPQRPGDAPVSSFPTGEVRSVATDSRTDETDKLSPPSLSPAAQPLPRAWKIGDPIVEPQGVYQLANGDLVMSRECPSQSVSQP